MSGERPKQTGRERADAQRKRAQAQKGQRHEQDSSLPPWLLPVGLAVVALAVGSGLYLSNQANQPIIHPATPGLADTIGPELQTGDIMPATMDAFAQVLQIQPADIGDPNKFSQTISDLIYGSKINKPLPKAVQLPNGIIHIDQATGEPISDGRDFKPVPWAQGPLIDCSDATNCDIFNPDHPQNVISVVGDQKDFAAVQAQQDVLLRFAQRYFNNFDRSQLVLVFADPQSPDYARTLGQVIGASPAEISSNPVFTTNPGLSSTVSASGNPFPATILFMQQIHQFLPSTLTPEQNLRQVLGNEYTNLATLNPNPLYVSPREETISTLDGLVGSVDNKFFTTQLGPDALAVTDLLLQISQNHLPQKSEVPVHREQNTYKRAGENPKQASYRNTQDRRALPPQQQRVFRRS